MRKLSLIERIYLSHKFRDSSAHDPFDALVPDDEAKSPIIADVAPTKAR